LRFRAISRIALGLCAAGLAASGAGCTNSFSFIPDTSEGGFFSKPVDLFAKPSWASSAVGNRNIQLNPTTPVAPEELVGVDGRCGAPVAEAVPAAPAPPPAERPGDRPVGSIAGDLASAPMPAATPVAANPNAGLPEQQPGAPQVVGGIALGMTECDVVRRAGLPGNVNIGVGDRGGRNVVLTYLSGTWPGIYTFDSGRLKIVDRAPVPETPAKSPAKKQKAKKATKPKTDAAIERPTVR
jgi:hypothetical protein